MMLSTLQFRPVASTSYSGPTSFRPLAPQMMQAASLPGFFDANPLLAAFGQLLQGWERMGAGGCQAAPAMSPAQPAPTAHHGRPVSTGHELGSKPYHTKGGATLKRAHYSETDLSLPNGKKFRLVPGAIVDQHKHVVPTSPNTLLHLEDGTQVLLSYDPSLIATNRGADLQTRVFPPGTEPNFSGLDLKGKIVGMHERHGVFVSDR